MIDQLRADALAAVDAYVADAVTIMQRHKPALEAEFKL
jgi:hypothetical protein